MQAIIPVAGAGTRLRPHTHTQPKPLMPVAGRPLLGHIVEHWIAAGVTDFVFVLGYMGGKVEEYITEDFADRVSCHFVLQEQQLGIAHAIRQAKEHIKLSEPSFIILGDTIVDTEDIARIVAAEDTTLGVHRVEDPRQFGVAVLGNDGLIDGLVEKPNIPKSNLALVGIYHIKETEQLFAAIDELLAQHRTNKGEYQLTDALASMLAQGVPMRTIHVRHWYDCGKPEVLLETNRQLLKKAGRVPETTPPDSVIIPPVYIPASCRIRRSIIGPNVTLGEGSEVEASIVSDAILGAYSTLQQVVLRHSIVGNDSTLSGHAHTLNIGDHAAIDFSA